MKKEKTYACYFECDEGEKLDLNQIFYYVKNWKMIEIQINEDCGTYIRQRKDIPMTYESENGKTFSLKYGDLYLTDGIKIYDVWIGRGQDLLAEWLEKCKTFNF